MQKHFTKSYLAKIARTSQATCKLVIAIIAFTAIIAATITPVTAQAAAKKAISISTSLQNNADLVIGKKNTLTVTSTKKAKAKITYKSSNTNVLSVDKKGQLTPFMPGKVKITITATPTAYKSTYKTTTKTLVFKVHTSKTGVTTTQNGKYIHVTSTKSKGATGYQFQYSTDKSFKKGVTTKTQANTTWRFKASTGKTYYVRSRSFAKITYDTDKTYSLYGEWSAIKLANPHYFLETSDNIDFIEIPTTVPETEIDAKGFCTNVTLHGIHYFENSATKPQWSVSDDSIASITTEGGAYFYFIELRAKKLGTFTVFCKINGVTVSKTITIKRETPVTKIIFDKETVTCDPSHAFAHNYDSNDYSAYLQTGKQFYGDYDKKTSTLDGHPVTFTSSNPEVATLEMINDRLNYNPLKNGETDITLTIDNASATFHLIVTGLDDTDSSVHFSDSDPSYIPATFPLGSLQYEDFYKQTFHIESHGRRAEWSISDESIASILDGSSRYNNTYIDIVPHKYGTFTLTCTVDGVDYSKEITVQPRKILDIQFSSGSIRTNVGKQTRVDFSYNYEDHMRSIGKRHADRLDYEGYDDSDVTLKSSKPSVATVSFKTDTYDDGASDFEYMYIEVKPLKVGECDITLTINGCSKSFHVVVGKNAKSSSSSIEEPSTEFVEETTEQQATEFVEETTEAVEENTEMTTETTEMTEPTEETTEANIDEVESSIE